VGEEFHQPLRFPGHFFDRETGLHYNRFRYYSPELGRYLEADPSGIEGGFNLYAYTHNPLSQVDLRGLSCDCPDGKDCPHRKAREEEEGRRTEGTDRPLTREEKLAKLQEQRRERQRTQLLDEAVKKADAKGARDQLTPEQRAWLDADPSHPRLAIDPEGSGKYRIEEAQAAKAAEAAGQVTPPVRRALGQVAPSESGADIVDGSQKAWDHKSASMGADDIAHTANGGEHVMVDCHGMDEHSVTSLETATRSQLQPDSGDVIFVRR
jgi:RHS repeat-associated protein